MEYLYSRLKKLDVVSVTDGKNFGKISDMELIMPEGKVKGFYVTGSKGFKFTKSDTFVPICDIVKIGEDTVLINFDKPKPPAPPPPPSHIRNRRNFDDCE